MSLFPSIGVPTPSAPLEALSRDLFECDFASVEWSPDTGEVISASGHLGTFGRGATLGSVIDVNGTPYTAVNAQPAWEQRDWDNDGVREAFGLRMSTNDRLAFPVAFLWPVGGLCGMLEIIETGARTNIGSTLVALTADDSTGNGFYLDATGGGFYQMSYSSGGTLRQAALTVGQPAVGDRVRFTWEITPAGVLRFYQSINGAARTSATAAALFPPTTVSADAAVRLNARGVTDNPANGWYRRLRLAAGALDQDVIAERR